MADMINLKDNGRHPIVVRKSHISRVYKTERYELNDTHFWIGYTVIGQQEDFFLNYGTNKELRDEVYESIVKELTED